MAKGTVANKLIDSHQVGGTQQLGKEVALKIDQTLTQDATGTLVMLELEKLELDRIKTETSVQYVDHNLLQVDNKNADDHVFLKSACQRFGLWFSPPGNGISHVIHMAKFGVPGKTLIGSDSHTCAGGALGMLAIGSGGLDIALAMAGKPFHINMPKIVEVKLTGQLKKGVSAKDIILEMLRRFDVSGGKGKIFEYTGEGLAHLSAMDRHVIANMGTELGATASVFPSDEVTMEFMKRHNREDQWQELKADKNCKYDDLIEIDLEKIVPLIAKPSSPGNVVPVSEIEGDELYQAYIGSSANPGFRDFAVVANMFKGKRVNSSISLDINPGAREILNNLAYSGHLNTLLKAGGRVHQSGCNGCIGMGQAPATDQNSLRTVPRNFPGRSGTKEDRVFLCSPETAAASAIKGKITSPLSLDFEWERPKLPETWQIDENSFEAPLPQAEAKKVELIKKPNVKTIPDFDALPDELKLPVLYKVKDDISTDEILPAGSEILPFRSNIEKISEFVYYHREFDYFKQAKKIGDHCLIAGDNYGQGSSREHAVLAPRYLKLRMVIAKSYSRIYKSNLINFGIIPFEFKDPKDYENIKQDDQIVFSNIHKQILNNECEVLVGDKKISVTHGLNEQQIETIIAGGILNKVKKNLD